jgi:hypothetical protein
VDYSFDPLFVDKYTFINHYKNKGLMEIIYGLSRVAESFGILDQLKQNPADPGLKNRLINNVIPELRKEPLGEKALKRINEVELYITMNNSLDTLEERIDVLLQELSRGYRVLLQRFVPP